jgi:AMP phosphorylase
MREDETRTVIHELMENKLSEVELASFVTSLYIRGLSDDETVYLTNAIVDSGKKLELGVHPIVDKHCSGGVAGNRTTMLLVPIIASSDLYIPKTSARSITSAAGTADTMEVLANVTFNLDEMRDIVLKTHGCIVWGGAIDLAAADDKLIRIRHSMRLDPRGVLLASILAKKKSVGAEYVVIDIPLGRGAKIEDSRVANDLARDFLELGARLGMKTECYVSVGNGPIGEGIGPALEARDVLKALQGNGPHDLVEKSALLAGGLFELCGKVEKGKGYHVAMNILKSGKAYEKMKEIIEAQGGNPKVKIDDIPIGSFRHEVRAEKEGRIHHVDNRAISRIARATGAPKNRGSGVLLHVKQGDKVRKGDLLFEIIAESETKLSMAIEFSETLEPVEMQKVILGKYV